MARKRRSSRARRTGEPPPQGAPAEAPPREGELLDMNQAAATLKVSRPTFYRWLRSGKVKGFKLGRQWRFYREDIERFLRGQEPRVDLPADLAPLLQTLRRRLDELGVQAHEQPGESDVVRAVAWMIHLAVAMEASDLHLEPQRKEEGEEAQGLVRVRVDGVLHPVAEFDLRLLPPLAERWLIMADCDVHAKGRPQDGRIVVKLADRPRVVDLRVNFLPAQLGTSVCARILDPAVVRPLDLQGIGYREHDRAALLRAIEAPWGLTLVTGPTGNGKTTTLYACLKHLASSDRKLISIEDPVEFLLPGILQVPVRPQDGATFPALARSALRAAANVILLGEVRDFETLQIAHQAAFTGHLVLTTLHADEAARGLVRMVEMGSDPFVVADSTRLVLAQRLIRRLCPECSAPGQPLASRLERAATLAEEGGVDWATLPRDWREPRGCARCHQTGFRGRDVIAEALEVTPAIGEALREGAGVDALRRLAVGQGMATMAADGIARAAQGLTSLDEVVRVI